MNDNKMPYEKVDGLKFCFQERYCSRREEFPHGATNYLDLYERIENYLNEIVHPATVKGALIKGDGLLNDHGPDHIAMVVQRVSLLLDGVEENLSGYELYLLLLSIHFHDVGNTEGREGHEKKIFEIMEEQGDNIPLENEEKEIVSRIAMAHGGYTDEGDKDTISRLNPTENIQGKAIRPRLLAAILRFADEIADESSRADRYFKGDDLPAESKIYHEYSSVLQPASIQGDTLLLKYKIPIGLACQKTSKGTVSCDGSATIENKYLYDEILSRIKKCLSELEYCCRYSLGLIRVSAISVNVSVRRPRALDDVYSDSFRVELSGYPSNSDKDIAEVASIKGAKNGEELKAFVDDERN